jgi:GntR family transcriptional regulator
VITLDVTGRTPIYEQICKGICGEISKGLLKENDRLPGARALAKELGLNPNTVAKAYSRLEHDGIIYSVQGKGCFIAKQQGCAETVLTRDFAEKVRETLAAGVSAQTLIDIINKISEERRTDV